MSVIERGLRTPSLETLERLLLVTGHQLDGTLDVVPTEEDPIHLAAGQEQTVADRIAGGFNGVELFNTMRGAATR